MRARNHCQGRHEAGKCHSKAILNGCIWSPQLENHKSRHLLSHKPL